MSFWCCSVFSFMCLLFLLCIFFHLVIMDWFPNLWSLLLLTCQVPFTQVFSSLFRWFLRKWCAWRNIQWKRLYWHVQSWGWYFIEDQWGIISCFWKCKILLHLFFCFTNCIILTFIGRWTKFFLLWMIQTTAIFTGSCRTP